MFSMPTMQYCIIKHVQKCPSTNMCVWVHTYVTYPKPWNQEIRDPKKKTKKLGCKYIKISKSRTTLPRSKKNNRECYSRNETPRSIWQTFMLDWLALPRWRSFGNSASNENNEFLHSCSLEISKLTYVGCIGKNNRIGSRIRGAATFQNQKCCNLHLF